MYRVALQNFEGPLDLLLYFIKQDEISIRDISISRITDQFIEYIQVMEELDLEIASEFILMAGTLMTIKARMLLPRVQEDDDELTEDDPRYELIQSLLEYKRYKETGSDFREMEKESSLQYYRGNFKEDAVNIPENGEALRDVTIIDLMTAIHDVLLRRNPEEVYHQVDKPETSVEEQSDYILKHLRKNGRTSFRNLILESGKRPVAVVIFLSVLELIKENQIDLFIEDDDVFEFYIDIPRISATELLSAN